MLLSDYEYVYQCLKFGTDVNVTMVTLADANQTFSYEVRNPLKYIVCTLHVLHISLLLLRKKITLAVSRATPSFLSI